MHVNGLGALHRDAEFPADVRGFHVEVVEDFDVIAQETDGTEDDRIEAIRAFGAQIVTDVGLEMIRELWEDELARLSRGEPPNIYDRVPHAEITTGVAS